MKKQFIKKLIMLSCLAISTITVLAQASITDKNLQDKYWQYRNRFKKFFINYNPLPDAFHIEEGDAGRGTPIHQHNIGKNNSAVHCEDAASNLKGHIKIGDAPEEMGMYMAALALEYRMLKDEGKDVKSVLSEIYYMLDAINRMDKRAERYMGGAADDLNGFLVRDDVDDKIRQSFVTESATTQSKEDRLACVDASHYPYATTDKGIEEQGFSKDHITDLFLGFSFITKYMYDAPTSFQPTISDPPMNITSEIKAITTRIMSFISPDRVLDTKATDIGKFFTKHGILCTSNINLTMNYVIYNPVRNKLVPRGNNLNVLAYPVVNIARNITGFPWDAIPLHIKVDGALCSDWNYTLFDKSYNLGSTTDKLPETWINAGNSISSLISGGNKIELCDTIINFFTGKESFCSNTITDLSYEDTISAYVPAYILCSLASQSGSWTHSNVVSLADHYDMWQFDLQYALLNNTSPLHTKSFFEGILNSAPCDGPYNYDDNTPLNTGNYSIGWYSTNKWTHPSNPIFNEPDHDANFIGDYPGHDYMFLYNMYRYYYKTSIGQEFNIDNSCPCNINEIINTNTDIATHSILINNTIINRKFKDNYKKIGIFLKEYLNANLTIQSNKILTNKTELNICNNITVNVKSNGQLINPLTNLLEDSVRIIVNKNALLLVENNGIIDIGGNSKLIIKNGGTLKADGANAKIIIRNGAKLIVESLGAIELINNGSLIIETGGKLIVEPEALTTINNNGKLIIEDNGYAVIKTRPVPGTSTLWGNAKLVFNQGAKIQLKGDNAVLELNGQLHIGDNATFNIDYPGTNSGYIKFNRGAGVWWDNWAPGNQHITCGTYARFHLVGQSKTDKMIEIDQNNVAMPKNLSLLILNKCQIEFNVPDAMIESNAATFITNSTFKGTPSSLLPGGAKNTRGLLVFGQDVCVINYCDFINLGTGLNGALFYGGYKQNVTNSNFLNNNIGLLTIGAGVQLKNNIFTNNQIAISNTDITNNSMINLNTITALDTNITSSGPQIGVYTMGSNIIYEARKNNINNTGYAFITDYNELKLRCNDLTNNSVATYIRNNAKLNMTTLLGAGFNNANNCNQFAKFEEAGYWDSQFGYNAFKINDNTPCYNTTFGSVTTRHCPTISEGTILNFNNYNTTTGLYEQPAEFNYWFNGSTLLEKPHNKVSKSPEHSGFSVPIYENVEGLNPLTHLASTDCPTPPGGGGGGTTASLRVHPLDNTSSCSNITTASFYNKRLQWALKQSLTKLDDLEDLPKLKEAVDLLTEILKANYPLPVINEVDDYLLELSYQKLFSGVAQIVELHKLSGGSLNPMPSDLQNRFTDLHDIISLRIARKNPAQLNYKVYTDLVKFDKALIYRLAENRTDAILKINEILADNPKPEHIKMLEHWRCVFDVEEGALTNKISVYQALESFNVCQQNFQNITSLPVSGARLLNPTQQNANEISFANNYEVAVFPNPTSGSLLIGYNLKSFNTITLEIYDIQGKKMKSYSLNNQETNYKIEDLGLENGVYIYQINVDGISVMNNKIVVLK